MLADNIKALRQQRGYSQETLAGQLNVVRQTISKWEQGRSVPDAELLGRLAEVLEVPVSKLLEDSVPEAEGEGGYAQVAQQLAILNEQLARSAARRRRTIRLAALGTGIAIFVLIVAYIFCFWMFRVRPREEVVRTRAELTCTLNGETYHYEIIYDDNFRILEGGGDAWVASHVQTEKYDDANVLMAQIEDYFTDRGGSCTVTQKGE